MICKFNTNNNTKKVIWEITNRCNYRCKYCIFNAGCDNSELSLEECKIVIDELIKNGFDYIKFTGGEPFIRKDFFDILEYANGKLKFDISTNASFINESHIEKLKKIDVNFIHVSVDGLEYEHELIRGKGTFDKTIEGIKALKKSGKYIRVGTVLFKENEDKIEEIVKMLESLDIDEVIFSIMEPFGKLNGDRSFCVTKDLKELSNIIESIKSSIKISYNWNSKTNCELCLCPAGDKILFIDNNGYVSPCTWLEKIDDSIRSKIKVTEVSLEQIISSFDIKKNICLYDEVIYGKEN